ncbi:MAG: UbiX family flavin prenyltransferase [Bacteroidales bacterium]|nr:UbiX family flavin prenyltransferase [Bacteroidales bacterium]
MKKKRKIVVAVTGASGALYARLLLGRLASLDAQTEEVAVVFSANATEIWAYETGDPFEAVPPFKIYDRQDFYAPFASGSSSFDTLIICPCSAGTLGRIAAGVSDDLITRAADVMLKERRRLILVPRETPYNLIHIENMRTVTLAGGIICPATPSFYSRPQTLEEAALTVTDRILSLAGFCHDSFRWGE